MLVDQKPRVLFIAGTHKGGSALLDLIISTDSETFSTGALNYIERVQKTPDMRCDCGQQVEDCRFWRGVREELEPEDYFK